MSDYQTLSSEVAHEGVLATVRLDRVRLPDGDVVEREIIEHSDAVAVVAVDDDGQVVLVRQYRQPVGEVMLELPAGKLDVDGEHAEAAARRELLEEVGLEAGRLLKLVTFHNSAGWTTETTTVYLADHVRDADVPADFTPHGEEATMQIVRLPLAKAVALAESGEVTDAKTLVGLLLAGSTLRRTGSDRQGR